ncbi:hypothetical protein SUGI_0381710 [Cryptomeria japonica]|nr:hypothetical protein SUGI_0381710 [Cryptomeria japonica]
MSEAQERNQSQSQTQKEDGNTIAVCRDWLEGNCPYTDETLQNGPPQFRTNFKQEPKSKPHFFPGSKPHFQQSCRPQYSFFQQPESNSKQEPKPNSNRFFVMKSLNDANMVLALKRGTWATKQYIDYHMEEAYNGSRNVILLFSVSGSHHFQGFAKMISPVGAMGIQSWENGKGGKTIFYRNFAIKWIKLGHLSMEKVREIKNPNSRESVANSRDGTELDPSVARKLLELIENEQNSDLTAIANEACTLMSDGERDAILTEICLRKTTTE